MGVEWGISYSCNVLLMKRVEANMAKCEIFSNLCGWYKDSTVCLCLASQAVVGAKQRWDLRGKDKR